MDMNLMMQRIEQLLAVGLSEEQFKKYLQTVLVLLTDLMRQLEGDEFTKGFLQAGINGINAGTTPIIKLKEVVRH